MGTFPPVSGGVFGATHRCTSFALSGHFSEGRGRVGGEDDAGGAGVTDATGSTLCAGGTLAAPVALSVCCDGEGTGATSTAVDCDS
jgi:hypothetical protein